MTLNAPYLQIKRPKKGDTLLVATHNTGKAREIANLLISHGFEILTLANTNLPAPEETGRTFEANAELKATHARVATGFWTLADDSGLEVLTLNGAPGVDTAHYGGWERLLTALHATPDEQRQARFVCVLALQSPDGETFLFTGTCEGRISREARGDQGFGYDPVFLPSGETRTFAEMSAGEKQEHSHRGQALRQLCAWLEQD